MTSREQILQRLRGTAERADPRRADSEAGTGTDMGHPPATCAPTISLSEEFVTSARLCHAHVERVADLDSAYSQLREALGDLKNCMTAIPDISDFPRPGNGRPADLHTLDAFACRAAFGVVENGAVWLPETLVESRAAPFLADRLFVVLAAHDLVADMHDACVRMAADQGGGFGTLVAGPSKTADIEQALVIGAQGPRSLTIFLVEDGDE